MRTVSSRAFNQDVSQAKRLALYEPVLVTDRGKPTHVLLSIEAWRELTGERRSMTDLLAAPAGAPAFDPADVRAALQAPR